MGSQSSKRCQQVRDNVPFAETDRETDRSVTSEFSIDCAETNAKNEKKQFPSTLQVDKSSPISFGEKKEEQKTREQEQSAMCPTGQPTATRGCGEVVSAKKEDKLKSHQMKPSHAGSDRRQQCGGAVNVPRHCHRSPVSNRPPMSSSDAGACSARRPQPVGGDTPPACLLPHVRQVTGSSPPPTYANASAADVYRHYRRLRRQREQSAIVAAVWILGNDFGGDVGSVNQPVGMLYYGHPPMVRTAGDGAESRN